MASGAYGVDLDGLHQAAHGIQSALDTLGQLGLHGEETSGSPIEDLALGDDELGSHEFGLANTLQELCGRAHYVARDILSTGKDMVGKLSDTRSAYQQVEDAAKALFNRIHTDMTGDPLPPTQVGGREVR